MDISVPGNQRVKISFYFSMNNIKICVLYNDLKIICDQIWHKLAEKLTMQK